jgi:hypothetical protein
MDEDGAAWFDHEIAGCHFADERLKARLRKLIARMGAHRIVRTACGPQWRA